MKNKTATTCSTGFSLVEFWTSAVTDDRNYFPIIFDVNILSLVRKILKVLLVINGVFKTVDNRLFVLGLIYKFPNLLKLSLDVLWFNNLALITYLVYKLLRLIGTAHWVGLEDESP